MLTKEEVAKMPRAERLARLGRAGHELDAAVEDRPETVLCRRPDEKNWAPKEIVCHLRDTEEFFMLRFQTLAAADEPPLVRRTRALGRRPPVHSERRRRGHPRVPAAAGGVARPPARAVGRPVGARGASSTYGRMTVEDVVNLMVWHDANHLDQLERALRGEA